MLQKSNNNANRIQPSGYMGNCIQRPPSVKIITLHVKEVIKYLITTESFSQPESHIHTTPDIC